MLLAQQARSWSSYIGRGEHAERGVPAAAVVEDFQVTEQGVGQFEAGAPALPVEQFGLDPARNDSIMALS